MSTLFGTAVSDRLPVCKTCSDCGHKCLGYSEPEKPEKPSGLGPTKNGLYSNDGDDHDDHQPLPLSPIARRASLPAPTAPQIKTSKSQQSKRIKLEASVPLTKDTLNKATRDQDKLAVIASPESSLSSNCDGVLTFADAITGRTSLSSGHRTHVPYFRYFGPTAIVPGFKQMV